MALTQTVDIPENRQITLPREIPAGRANIIIFPIKESETPKTTPASDCAKNGFRLEGDFSEPLKERVFGCVKGDCWMSDDFCEPLEDFKDYM